MAKKKRGHPDVEEILSRPWCYYCERDFDDQKVLINHQKAKHFKCERCGRRLNTAGGLSVHMSQVHKETLSAVDNALPNRAGLDIEIFGMEGIPEDIVQQHNQRVLIQYHQAEAERRAASGSNIGAGGVGGSNQPKRPKFESPSDLKKRLAEHKAKLAGEQANGGNSGSGTPNGAANGTGANQSAAVQATAPQYPPQQHFNGAPGNASFNFPPGYGQPGQQAPLFQQVGGPYPQQSPFSPSPFPNQVQYSNPQFPPAMMPSAPPQFQGGPLGGNPSVPRPFGVGSPVQQFGYQPQQIPPRINTPPQIALHPQRSLSGSLPPAPGLPQRPAFGAPHINHFQMQQLHQGQLPAPPGLPINHAVSASTVPQNNLLQQSTATVQDPQLSRSNETSLDDLISGAVKQADREGNAPADSEAQRLEETTTDKAAESPVGKSTTEIVEDKKDKKEKAKASRLVYSDQDTSPEEKMARMSRYAFTPSKAG